MPTPPRALSPCRNGSKIAALMLVGHARALVLHDQRRRRRDSPATSTWIGRARRRVPRGVVQQVLDDPLGLRRVDVHQHRVALDADGMPGQRRQLGGEAIGDRLHVGRLALGLELAAVEPVEVEEVVHEPRRLRARLLDHAVQVLHLLVGQVQLLGAPDRLHRAEHAGQRALQVVRHRVQQRVLHVVLVAQVVGELGLLDQTTALTDARCLERVDQPHDEREHHEPHDRVPRLHEHARPVRSRSASRVATAAIPAIPSPHARPPFQVTSTTGIR